jgi:hypothetical protein
MRFEAHVQGGNLESPLVGYCNCNALNHVSMRVQQHETVAYLMSLGNERFKEGGFTASGLPNDVHVRMPIGLPDA